MTASDPAILSAEPQLFVTDIAACCDYFVRLLGFRVAFVHGEPAFYAQVERGGARLNLRHVDRLPFDAGFRAQEHDALSATLVVDGIDALFSEYEAAGVEFHQALKAEPWGARTFIVADPDGNLIAFAAEG